MMCRGRCETCICSVPVLEAMLAQIRAGTILVVWDFRDARKLEELSSAREYGGDGDEERGIV